MNTNMTGKVTILSVTQFDRVNEHVNLQWPEHFVAISMKSEDGAIAVTFTRKHSKFAEAVKVGDTLTISGKYKRVQDHGNVGGQVVITNCMISIPASVGVEAARKAKAAARLAKLFA